jgi:MFS transporter, DHA1 family, solute carrier family 18 (vesicular amine transporter), member 1/2
MPDQTGRLRGSPKATLVAVTVALFTDSFLYGLVIPLAAKSPAKIEDEWALGLMYGAYAMGLFLTTPTFGVVADRHGRRWPMVSGVFLQAAATVLFAVGATFGEMFIARIVQGVAAAATWTAGLALVAELFPEKRTQMMGFAMMGSTGGSVLGPVAGGYMADLGGYHLPFVVAGAMLAVDALMRIALIVEPPREAGQRSDLVGLLRDRSVLAASVVVVLGAGGWGLLEPLLPSHLTRVAGASSAMIGLIFTISTATYGACSPFVDRVAARYGLRPTMVLGLFMMAGSLPLLGLTSDVFWAGLVLCIVDVSTAFTLNTSLSELAEVVDRRGSAGYASVYAVYNIAYAVGSIGSDVMAGVITSRMSFMAGLLATSAIILVCTPLLYLGRPRSPAVG